MSSVSPKPLPDCFDDPELLPAGEALARIERHVGVITDTEAVELRDALGRILGADVVSPLDVPGHTNSAMDGYAFAGAGLPSQGRKSFEMLGTAWAGRPYPGEVAPGCTVQVMTGAVMPGGTDTVVMQEQVDVEGARVTITSHHKPGQNVRAAGEDIRRGDVVLDQGKRLLPAELGVLASLGIARVSVRRRPRVAMFSTGDELRSLGEALEPGAVYDSNRYTLFGMLTRLGVELIDLGVIRDDRRAIREAFENAAAEADIIITSGGASSGEADYIKETLDALGQVGFWRIAIRPGRPLAFGRVGDAVFFGLPGNPVAVMMTFYQFVQPAIAQLMGQRPVPLTPTVQATCVSRLRKKPGRVEYYRAFLERDAQDRLIVRHIGKTGSGLLHTMSDANCLILLDDEAGPVEPGTEVPVQPFFGLV